MSDTGDVVVTIEGQGPTIVDALAEVLLNAQDRLLAMNSVPDGEDDG